LSLKTAPSEPTLHNTQMVVFALVILGVPTLGWSLYARTPDDLHGALVAGFLTVITFERVWETFFTGKPEDRKTRRIDNNLKVATATYILMLYGTEIEFFLVQRTLNPWMTVIGLLVLLLSFWLRWWSVTTLGDQWSISIRDDSGTASRLGSLIRTGPYAYLRHPIYLAVILEVVAIPLVANAHMTLLFVVLINIPTQFIRARLEEQTMLSRFGTAYARYMEEIRGFVPFPRGRRSA
jgi:methyltransferase